MLYLWVYERCIRQRRQESEVKKMLAETICRIKKTGLMGIVRVETIERGIEIAQDASMAVWMFWKSAIRIIMQEKSFAL